MYTQPPEARVAPKRCPFCLSIDIRTTSKRRQRSHLLALRILRRDLERRPTVARMAPAIRPVK
jgi:hypothetical protein